MSRPFSNYQEFYLFYLGEHQNARCRLFHAVGTTLVIFTLVILIATGEWKFWFLLPLFGYGFSWIGHFKYERNKPAAFKYPFYSLISDFRMYGQMWTGQLDAQLKLARHYSSERLS